MTKPGEHAIPWEEEGERLAGRSLAANDPTGWFDELYAAAAAGTVQMPWSRLDPHPLLVEWAQARALTGRGQRAVVVGCGLGADAEFIASVGFETVAFDISSTAIRLARQRFPRSAVHYLTADLLNPPSDWFRAFDLVAEIITVQALPDPSRRNAIVNVSRLVAANGTLFVIAAAAADEGEAAGRVPPWPLRRAEVEMFAADDLTPIRIELVTPPGQAREPRWRAVFHRDRRR